MDDLTIPGTLSRAERLLQDSPVSPEQIFALIADRLASVEELFGESLASPVEIVREIGSFVAETGGKRVRPTLHLLTARLCRYEGPHDVLLGVVLEFIHSATLIHDDIIDGATVRRGRPSVNYQWGNNITVLFGDYLFAKAMQMALRAGSLRVMEALADVTIKMVEGELLQNRYEGRIDVSEAEYIDLIERKTAGLFSCCCELAGILAGVSEERLGQLKRYGLNLGMAFQIVDDLLDFTGDSKKLGKPSTSDLREGKVTLPVIDVLARNVSGAKPQVEAIMNGAGGDPAAIRRLNALLTESGALDRARARARQYATAATVELGHFADSPARQALETLPDLLLSRDR